MRRKGASFIQQLAPTRLAEVACFILISCGCDPLHISLEIETSGCEPARLVTQAGIAPATTHYQPCGVSVRSGALA